MKDQVLYGWRVHASDGGGYPTHLVIVVAATAQEAIGAALRSIVERGETLKTPHVELVKALGYGAVAETT